MADGFGAVSFGILISKPGESVRAEYTVQHVAYSNINYLDLGGLLPKQYPLRLRLANNSDYVSLQGLVNTQATLTYNGTAYTNALLSLLDRVDPVTTTVVLADALFIVP
jgi:hypothetical protein